ncbi:MAG: hypothetical protein CVV06_12605 [Gammaproteobacteria bacterium HGW-Gammaproteobacteria-10]|nr:MAG: hypothetical protein CVV06_12605 [Gammaproteobacteria bacterium HGW-Gammaproteobacteria-10]
MFFDDKMLFVALLFIDGFFIFMSQLAQVKIGRNDPCPCGSGKKFKACCGMRESVSQSLSLHDQEMLHRQAQTAVGSGDYTEAERCFRLLHQTKPKDTYFLASLGQALCWLKRRKEGVDFLLQAAKLLVRQIEKNREPRFAVDLSAQLLHWGETDAAERLARVAVRIAPDSPVALNNLALCLARVNRNREALPISQKVCRLLPDHPGCNILLAFIEHRLGQGEQSLKRLSRVIERNDEPLQTARAWLETGVILDKQQRYEEAFAALSRAGAMHSAEFDYPPDRREYFFDNVSRNREGFDEALLNRWTAAQVAEDGLPSPAFLMGFLRSGTTLTEQVIGAHPDLIATDEATVVYEMGLELAAMTGISDDQPAAVRSLNLTQIALLRQFYWRRMREEFGEEVMHKQLVDKHALNTIDLGMISVVFPEAKILFALRDPRDVCLSCFMQAFTPAPATINLLSWEGIAHQYEAVMDYWLYLRNVIQPSAMELRYEDTINDFETSYRRVFEFLGLDWTEEVTRFYEKAQGRYVSTPSFAQVSQPIYRSALARWQHYPNQVAEIMPKLRRFIEAFDYPL